jgi:GNAT superfamily N-acetyltransferase
MMWDVLKSNAPARRFYAAIGEEIDDQIAMWMDATSLGRLAAAASPPDGLRLRRAAAADCPLLARFLSALLDDLDIPQKTDAVDRLRVDGFGNDPAFTAVIAERAGAPVGYALFWPTYDTEEGRRGGWLSDLYVVPEARRHGVAMALMSGLARRTVAAGGAFLTWLVHEGNREARAFYGRFAREDTESLACICAGERFQHLADSAGS